MITAKITADERILIRQARAVQVAQDFVYSDEYDEDSELSQLVQAHRDGNVADVTGADRWLFIATENGGTGPADTAIFYRKKADAISQMGVYAREGWVSSLYDLDSPNFLKPVKERDLR
jgi:hypothetical protein